MSELRNYLAQRETVLVERIKKLEAEMQPLRADLAEVRAALAALPSAADLRTLPLSVALGSMTAPTYKQERHAQFEALTIKDLVRRALTYKPMTALEMVDYFKTAFGRNVLRESLSPQLSRLKVDGEIDLKNKTWFLTPKRETPPDDQSEGVSKSTDEVAASSLDSRMDQLFG